MEISPEDFIINEFLHRFDLFTLVKMSFLSINILLLPLIGKRVLNVVSVMKVEKI